MKKWGLLAWIFMCFIFVNEIKAQNISNEGTDFWAVFPSHDPAKGQNQLPQYAQVRIYVTSKTSSEVVVSCGTYQSPVTPIPANTAIAFDIPRNSAYIESTESNVVLSKRGIHIVVSEGKDRVAVYEHIYAGARSAASLILPKESLGQKYYSMNYTQSVTSGDINENFLTLVATEPNTTLLIHKKDGTSLSIPFVEAGEVYQYLPSSREDLTGVFVEVDPSSPDNCSKRFAAFSGSTSVTIGCSSSKDPLFQQLYPTTSWGQNYGIVPFYGQNYLIRILAQEDGTNVQFNGESFVLNKGQYYQSPTVLTQALFISADKKISVAQYALTQDCASALGNSVHGDPEMVLLNPVEFNIKSVTMFSSDKERIDARYINVCIKTNATASFRINGNIPPNGTWSAIPSKPEYSFIQISISDPNSVLTASEGFNAIAYGFGDHESYAYSAGTNLAANNYLLVSNKITNRDAPNACINQVSDFKIVLPYKAINLVWKLDNMPAEVYTPEPVVATASGSTSYTYVYPKDITYLELIKHTMVVVAKMPNIDNCLAGEIEYTYEFSVNPLPTAGFDFETDACADTETIFRDKSVSNIEGKLVNKWLWNFGDGETSEEQSPKHIYSTSGDKNVTLSAGLDDGCMADVVHTIHIRPKINTSFTVDVKGCVGTGLAFHDTSMPESGNIVKWYWDFGDGTQSFEQNPVHPYLVAGTYKVVLITETENGCKSLPFPQDIVINELPKPDFSMPKICEADDLAVFTNLSTEVGGSISGSTYIWDFGDGSDPTTNGSHKYPHSGPYAVKLTVINTNGCTNTLTKIFTVNDSEIHIGFSVIDEDNLCSNKGVVVKNTSSVDVGKIAKIWIYMDVVNKPDEYIEYLDPEIGQEFAPFLYPAATSANSQTITIKLVAFSGIKCSKGVTSTITLHAAPSVSFDAIDPVCINGGKILLTNGRELLGVPGSYKYSGDGITEDGLFNPMVAGLNEHKITYTFNSTNGCADSYTRSIMVYPAPTLNLSPDIYLLTGGEKKMDAIATGYNLKYQWTPSKGLSSDVVANPVVSVENDMEYTLTVTSGQDCYVSKKISVHVIPAIEPVNTFTPNGDGINDVWNLKYIDSYPNTTVEIFNRNGIRVFFSKGYSVPFDGNYNNQSLPVGTYYYIINPKNGKKNVTGYLTLIR